MLKEIRDYNVRIWGNDVFINGKGINVGTMSNLFGLQCNYDEMSREYKELQNLYFEIREKFLKFNRLIQEENEQNIN